MIYEFDISKLPEINSVYSVTRRTIWQVVDPYNLLIFVQEGRCSINLDHRQYILQKGDLFFIPANQSYTRMPVDEKLCTLVYFHFTTKAPIVSRETIDAQKQLYNIKEELDNRILLSQNYLVENNRVYLPNHIPTGKLEVEVNWFVQAALNSILKNNIESKMIATLCLCHLLAAATQITISNLMTESETILESSIPPKLKKAIMYIRNHYSQKITLEDLCTFCNISKQQLIRYFKSVCGKTPIAYILEFKLNKAKEMFLNHPDLTIKEVAHEVGFDDQHYFSRVFTKINNETPTQFKYRVQNFDESKQ